MATDREILTSGGEVESTEQTLKQAVPPALKVVGSDGDLRSKNLSVRILMQNPAQDTPRSSSADGGSYRVTPLTLSLHTETKAAFEDSPRLRVNDTSGNEQSKDESARLLTSPSITDHVTNVTDATDTTSSTCEKKDDNSKNAATITSPINKDGNQSQVVFTGENLLFKTRTPGKERPYHAFTEKPNSLLFFKVPSYQRTEGTKSTALNSHQTTAETNSKHNNMEGDGIKPTSYDENNDITSKGTKLQTDKETTQEGLTNQADTRERADTIEPLEAFSIRQSETHRRRSSSTATLPKFTSPFPPGELVTSGSRRVSNFPTPGTSGQSETSPSMGSSDIPAATARRDSRRRSSITASALGSSNATRSRRDSVQSDGKKGSIGFGTLASSLVKWKINTLRAAKKAKETIAKDAKHQEFMDRTADRVKTELPRSLLVSIQEEAYPIILRTAQAYRSQLGAKHKVTVQASDRLADLIRDLKTPY
ncbi:hypothetical protein ACROYT_G040531 [Oculina patagonica]